MFQRLNILEFTEKFSTDNKCREYLASQKWEKGYECGNCSHTRYYNEKQAGTRICCECKYSESATARTLFHMFNFLYERYPLMHRQIMMFKAWPRGIHHHCSHLQRDIDEFCYRFNRLKYPDNIFHNPVKTCWETDR